MSHNPLDFGARRSTVAAIAMLTFNVILRAHGYDPAEVSLVRHALTGRSAEGFGHQERLVQLWRDDPMAFELYQRRQPRAIYGQRRLAAVFLGQPRGRTVLAGFWRVDSVCRDATATCPVTGQGGVESISTADPPRYLASARRTYASLGQALASGGGRQSAGQGD